jgi:nucleoside-diphosphate kinase
MALQRTLSIVKPDGVARHAVGEVLRRFEKEGFRILGLRMIRLGREAAEGFYAVHRGKPFFDSLCTFMSSGPAVVVALEGEDAIARLREVMGSTDPAKAAEGTIRKLVGTNIERNAVHGSDSEASAAIEIPYFFRSVDLCGGTAR